MRETGRAATGHIAIYLLGVWLAVSGAAAVGVAEAQTSFADDFVPQPAYAGQTRAPLATQSPRLIFTTLTTDLFNPFGLQWLPDGRMLVTESVGRLRVVDSNGTLAEPIEGLPPIWAVGFNGLHDLALDPGFAENRHIYFAYAAPPEGSTIPGPEEDFAETARRLVARARLSEDETRLEDVEIIFEAMVRRLAFGPDGKLYMTTQAAQAQRANAQDMNHLGGKVLRTNPDGSIPEDNPWVGDDSIHDAVFANGLRDPSGAAFNPGTGELWTVEHGPRGGDELNIVRAGRNYGWPIITYGREYDEEPLGDGLTAMDGVEQPNYFWAPSIAPSSLMFYTADLIPHWTGNAFVTTLAGEHLARLELVGDRVVAEERLFVGNEQRLRTASQGPDGALYLLVAGEQGSVIRLTPKPVTNPLAE